jgi:hypothetical protein
MGFRTIAIVAPFLAYLANSMGSVTEGDKHTVPLRGCC